MAGETYKANDSRGKNTSPGAKGSTSTNFQRIKNNEIQKTTTSYSKITDGVKTKS